jgi:tetratricopeptide (TPR) repeat protein
LSAPLGAQTSSERVQVTTPSGRRVDLPSPTASADELEARGDELRSQKDYLDALDYYRVALQKSSKSARIHNKAGIAELQVQRYKEGRKDFEHAIKLDREFADAYNNLGVIFYKEEKYDKAINRYEKAIQLRPDAPSYYSNLGAAYYAQKNWEQATVAYSHAIQLDPDIFERISHSGVTAQLPSPDERARFDYLLAKLYAKEGDRDRSLKCLRRAMEDGYKDIDDVYKDPEFTALRTDERFGQLMAARPPAIPE